MDTSQLCPLGDDTLTAMVKAGYAALAVGLIALYENSYQEGEIFSAKQLKACGIGESLAKTIVNQCEGREVNKRKAKAKAESKLSDLSEEEDAEFQALIEQLDSVRDTSVGALTIQGMSPEERDRLPQRIKWQYSWLFHGNTIETVSVEPACVKELFSKVVYKNQAESLDISAYRKRGRGKPGRLFVLSSKDALAKCFGVRKSDEQQTRSEIHGHKTTKSLCDALYVEWMKRSEKQAINDNRENAISMVELQNVLGEGHTTIRRRHQNLGIKVKHNHFQKKVSWPAVAVLQSRARGDLWFELDLPAYKLPSNVVCTEHIKSEKRYRVKDGGFGKAHAEWVRSGRPGDIFDHLNLCGYTKNSYSFLDRSQVE